MKVLQLAYKSNITGGEKVLLQLCDALSSASHSIHCCCPERGELTDALEERSIEYSVIPFSKTYDLNADSKIVRLIKEQRIELLHSHGMLVNILGRLACRSIGGFPSISTVHLTRKLSSTPRVGGMGSYIKNNFYYRLLDNWSSSFSNRVVAVSRAVREDLLEQGYPKEKIVVIPNGIDANTFTKVSEQERRNHRRELGIDEGDTLFGTIARLSPQKDVTCFLEALARQEESCKAFIAGDGPLREQLMQRALALSISHRCHFLGHRRDIAALLKACDVFVLSSRWEGLPLTILEAMASSLPVNASAVDGSKEAVIHEETGILVEAGKVDQFSKAMALLAADPKLRQRYGSASLERVKKVFTIERVAKEHLKLYEEVLEEASES